MITAIRLPWELLIDLELEAQRLDVSRSQLVCEYVAAGLGAKIPAPVQRRRKPQGRKRRTRYIPFELRENSAPWLVEPKGAANEGHVEGEDNPRRAPVRRPVLLEGVPPGGEGAQ